MRKTILIIILNLSSLLAIGQCYISLDQMKKLSQMNDAEVEKFALANGFEMSKKNSYACKEIYNMVAGENPKFGNSPKGMLSMFIQEGKKVAVFVTFEKKQYSQYLKVIPKDSFVNVDYSVPGEKTSYYKFDGSMVALSVVDMNGVSVYRLTVHSAS
jgi:hypothetical protein